MKERKNNIKEDIRGSKILKIIKQKLLEKKAI